MHDFADEHFALVQDAIDQVPDTRQVKEDVLEEVRDVVQELLKITVEPETLHAIEGEVKTRCNNR